MRKTCELCGKEIGEDYPGLFCRDCGIERLKEKVGNTDATHFSAEDMATLLGFQSAVSVKRQAQKGNLPPRIPGIKKYLWMPEGVYDWLTSEYKAVKDAPWTEEQKALNLAHKTGTPIPPINGYGHHPQGLIEWYRKWKDFYGDKS